MEPLDTFPYRHRVAELMVRPIVTIDGTSLVADAVRLMNGRHISSVIVVDAEGRLQGILTERDVLKVLARDPTGLTRAVSAAMTCPVHSVEADTPVYRALARMTRLGIRHLPVVDDNERPIGMLTSRALLKLRASLALTIGDEIACAGNGATLRAIHDRLPELARALRAEALGAAQVSNVIAGIVRDLSARAADLALAGMTSGGRGPPPSDWCFLVLGSAGRGESLLAADQDNALIHTGRDDNDAWFASFAELINRLLDEAGVPYCKGGVMASNPPYRHSLTNWHAQIDRWIARRDPEAILGVDIFYDFTPVAGARRLAIALREHATLAARRSPSFLQLLAAATQDVPSATDLLGRLRTRGGRIDLKKYGLFPIVAGARVAALAWGSAATGTDARLVEVAAKGAFAKEAAQALSEARAILVEAILDQQLHDSAAGRPADNEVDPARYDRPSLSRLRDALAIATQVPELVHDALSNRPLVPTP